MKEKGGSGSTEIGAQKNGRRLVLEASRARCGVEGLGFEAETIIVRHGPREADEFSTNFGVLLNPNPTARVSISTRTR